MSVNASGLAASSAPGGIYNSSHVPAGLPWYTYSEYGVDVLRVLVFAFAFAFRTT